MLHAQQALVRFGLARRLQQLHIGLGLVGAHGGQGHGQLFGLPRDNAALQVQARAHDGDGSAGGACVDRCSLHTQIDGHAARTCLGAGVDAHHARGHGGHVVARALDLQQGLLADLHTHRIGGRQLGHDFEVGRIDDLQHPRFHAHALAVLHQALRDLPVHGAAQHAVGHALAGHIGGGLGGGQVGACGIEVGLGGGQRRGRNEALRDQGLVVVVLALGQLQLRLGRIGLLAGLAPAGLDLGGVHAGQFLALVHAVALAHLQAAQLAGHIGLDHGAAHGLHHAADGHGQLQLARLQLHHFLRTHAHRHLARLGGCGDGALLAVPGGCGAPYAGADGDQ